MSEVSKLVALDATGMHAAPRVAMIFVSQYQCLASSRQSYNFHAIFKFRGLLPGMPPRRNVLPAPHESNPKSPLDVPGVVKKETASRASIFGRVALFSACWMIVAVSLKLFLEPSLEGKIFDIFVQVQFCILALALFDVLLSFNSPARWFLIHAFGNFVVVWFSISDTVRYNSQCAAVDFGFCFPQSHSCDSLIWGFQHALILFSALHDHEPASGKLAPFKLHQSNYETHSPPPFPIFFCSASVAALTCIQPTWYRPFTFII